MTTASARQFTTKKVVCSYLYMIIWGLVIILAARTTALFLNKHYPLTPGLIQFFEDIGYLGWCATLGMLGWELQTFDGLSRAERLNQRLAKTFSFVGIFAFILARGLVARI